MKRIINCTNDNELYKIFYPKNTFIPIFPKEKRSQGTFKKRILKKRIF